MKPALFASALLMASPTIAAQVDDQTAIGIAKPQETIVGQGVSKLALQEMLTPVEAFYGFWNNGSQKLLDEGLSPKFVDHTLPPGRPQGPDGPASASKAFLGAVPDLKVEVVQRLIVADRVVSHLHFTGHFTGTYKGTSGTGQSVDFIATDILRVTDGKVTDNWHLEDNLTFLQQIGLVPKS